MASAVYDLGMKKIVDQTLNVVSDTLKVMLVNSGYTFAAGETSLTTPSVSEIVATNYTGGFGGAGRKVVTVTATQDDSGKRVILKFTNLTWTALGGASNDTITGIILMKEVTNNGASIPIAYWGVSQLTNGSDITLSFDATNGNVRFNC